MTTGACDDLAAIFARRTPGGTAAWVHVDGAFGLWAAASPSRRHLVAGIEQADSWGCDGHKWLNVPYDSGFAFCAHPGRHVAAMRMTAAYLGPGAGRPRRPTSCPSRRAGPAVSRCGRRSASWAAAAWPTSSTAAARWPGASPTGWAR